MPPRALPAGPIDARSATALFAELGHARFEMVGVAYFDPEWRLLGMRHRAGTIRAVTLPVRILAHDAFAFDAAHIMLAHNHPSGDPTPSPADLALTRSMARGLEALGIRLVDHLILAGDATVSLRALGIL